jgi:hypothetical protein
MNVTLLLAAPEATSTVLCFNVWAERGETDINNKNERGLNVKCAK